MKMHLNRGGQRFRRDVLRLRTVASVANAVRRFRMMLGYVPNVEWFRAGLSRAVALDRAKAHIAIAELERCLLLRRAGVTERCFGRLRR
ncbi:MAG: hypothetical protein QOJ39_3406 [Candidatus Eremiobacteraeota bacterium]|jgi:hypothetical protein|nr:hypothetical protein [Candidatus Eremiobacteraeota bacterium]MEA2721542.1 hypothetical protein [Candidatus Eremiobacteraeota bacterium]